VKSIQKQLQDKYECHNQRAAIGRQKLLQEQTTMTPNNDVITGPKAARVGWNSIICATTKNENAC
jgi:hypothetical protein